MIGGVCYAKSQRNRKKVTTRNPLDRFNYQDREQPVLQRGSKENDYDVDGEHTYTRKNAKWMEDAGHGDYPHRISGGCRNDAQGDMGAIPGMGTK